jgi:hypothetical protein
MLQVLCIEDGALGLQSRFNDESIVNQEMTLFRQVERQLMRLDIDWPHSAESPND